MILIGSRALMVRAPALLNKPPRDFDFIATKDEAMSWLSDKGLSTFTEVDGKIIVKDEPPCEFEQVENRKSCELFVDLVKKDKQTINLNGFGLVPNIDLLFTLKASHRFLKNSPHFWKTAVDYHKLKSVGATIRPEYTEFFKMREKETYNYSHPKLNVKKDEFFQDNFYKFDHDDLHKAVKHLERPAYTYYMKDGSEVECDMKKFFEVSEEIRLYGVLEEAYVLALERSQIPHPGKMTPRQSFMLALSKTLSSICSGKFRSYGYENIFTIIKMYDGNYVKKFEAAVEAGLVKKFKEV